MPSEHELSSNEVLYYWLVSSALCAFSGIFSGLTLALFSIDVMYLKVCLRTGSAVEKKRASSVLPLLEHHHLTLVTLLLSNASCMTALPIFLEHLLDPATALIVSVTAVLIFGEVVPQATFVKHATAVGDFFAPLIWLMMGLTLIVSYPISKLLDAIVGHKQLALERDQLGEFFSLHGDVSHQEQPYLSEAEVQVMRGAMLLTTKTVKEALRTPLDDMFMLSSATALDRETVEHILLSGYSRVPIFKDDNRKHILGVLLVKTLLPLAYENPADPPKTGEYHIREVLRVSEEAPVQDLYEAFQGGQSHMAVVYNRTGTISGFVTLEDVLELLHNIAINDEMDLDQRQPAQFELRQKQLMNLYGNMLGSNQ